ncbi:MAG: hypothetical protein U0324_44815 [Polyangiales bacterium]
MRASALPRHFAALSLLALSATSLAQRPPAYAPGRAPLALGEHYGCALRGAGEVWCWGANHDGRLHDGTRLSRDDARPMRDVSDAVALAIARDVTCVLRADRTVACALHDDRATTLTPVEGLARVDALFGNERGTFWALSGGAAWCFGARATDACRAPDDRYTRATRLAGVQGVRAVRSLWETAGSDCLVLANGTLRCPQSSPDNRTWRGLTNVADAFNVSGLCRLDRAGVARCTNWEGTRVLATFRGSVEVADNGFDSLACARLRDGAVRCVGDTAHTEGGNGPSTPIPPATALALWGGTACTRAADQSVRCWGDATHFALHDVLGVEGARDVSVTQFMGCANTAGGPRCWGNGRPAADVPAVPEGGAVRALDNLAVVLDRGGAMRLGALFGRHARAPVAVTWTGYNHGDLFALDGRGALFAASRAVDGAPFARVFDLEGVRGAAMFEHGVCVVTREGDVRCGNPVFQGGLDVNLPRIANVTEARAVVADDEWGCALHGGGEVSCWGVPFAAPWVRSEANPTRATSTGVRDATALAGAGSHVCALHRGGRVSCWGRSAVGALLTGTSEEPAPRDVGVEGVTALAADRDATCVVQRGRVRCAGRGAHGSLGDGTGTSAPWVQLAAP